VQEDGKTMKKVGEVVAVAILTAVAAQIVAMTSLEFLWQHFLVRLWPMWLGLTFGGLYWCFRDYQTLRRQVALLERETARRAEMDKEISKQVTTLDAKQEAVTKAVNKKVGEFIDDLEKRVANLEQQADDSDR
jgi:hypothetical protein